MHFYASSVNKGIAITDETLKTTVRNLFFLFLYSCFSATVNLLSYCIIVYYLPKNKVIIKQGYNARKVISEVYASFVPQCTVSGRSCKHKTDVEAWHGIHLSHKNQWNILDIGNYYVSFQDYQNLMLLTSSDTKRTLMHLF